MIIIWKQAKVFRESADKPLSSSPAKFGAADEGIEVLTVGVLRPLTAGTGEPMRFLTVIVIIAALAGISPGVRAETALAQQGQTANPRLNFVIHIPESLFLRIEPSDQPKDIQQILSPPNPAAVDHSEPTISVNAVGTLATGGTMALSSQVIHRTSPPHDKPPPMSGFTSSPGGVNAPGEDRHLDVAIHSGRHSHNRVYTFQRIHPDISKPEGARVTYTLSSP